jgi:uncharacterized membrane protein HdeD (DUF308 family)
MDARRCPKLKCRTPCQLGGVLGHYPCAGSLHAAQQGMYEKPRRYPWGLPVALGLFLIILGGIAIAAPLLATFELSWLLGVVFIISGITQLIHTFRFDPNRSKVGRLMLAALAIVAGILVLGRPVTGAFAITLVMAFYFLATSFGRAALAFEFRNGTGKGWLAFSAIVSLFLGVYLLATLSTSSLVIPGLFLGVDLIFFGITLMTIGAGLRSFGVVIEPGWPRKVA